MKASSAKVHQNAFTCWELMVVLAVLALLGFMLLPALAKAKVHSGRNRCYANLKMIGFSFRMFAGDHEGSFPFNTTNSLAFQNTSNAWLHFLVLSNELGSAKNLMCPQDDSRLPSMASSFGIASNGLSTFQNRAVSYFVNVDADKTKPDAVLAGDRNVFVPGHQPKHDLLEVPGTSSLQWNYRLHTNQGCVVLSDGSASALKTNYPAWKSNTDKVRLLLPN